METVYYYERENALIVKDQDGFFTTEYFFDDGSKCGLIFPLVDDELLLLGEL
jgi:hypothetical protein